MIIRLEVGMLETNCYIFVDDKTNEGMIIDPGDDAARILENAKENKVNVKYVILTHGHWDHIGVLDRIKLHTDAQVMIHADDEDCLKDATKSLSYMFGINSPTVKADKLLVEGDEIKIGNSVFKVIHTPGHTEGSICLQSGNILFAGDTIFRGTVGRTDLPGGNCRKLKESIKTKLMSLDDEVNVYPGHGPYTTIGKERPYLER